MAYKPPVDLMEQAALEVSGRELPDADTERCLHCHLQLGVCACIPGERAILDDDCIVEDNDLIVDAIDQR